MIKIVGFDNGSYCIIHFLVETWYIFFINNGKLSIDFYNLSDDFLSNKKLKTFNGCFVYNDFGIFDLDFNFFVFLLIDLYPIPKSSHPFLVYVLNFTEKEKSLQGQALK